MAYNVVETRKMIDSLCYDMVNATTDIENGFLVKKGDLVTGSTNIYNAEAPTDADEVFLVANPAWSYDTSKAEYQNEEYFINVKGTPFRTYSLKKDQQFAVYSVGIAPIAGVEFAEGQLVVVDGTTFKPKALATGTDVTAYGFVGKIVAVEEFGFPFCVGSFGTPITLGAEGMGYGVDTRVKKIIVEVVKNA